jgi:hypothetical protein
MQATHVTSEPAILYFGTPVALISTAKGRKISEPS